MIYPKEFPRPRRPIYGNYGEKLNVTKPQPLAKSRNLRHKIGLLWPYLKEYAMISSVHGIRYLADPKMKHFERIIWLLILITTSIGAIVVYVDLNNLYQSIRIQTTIRNTMHPIFRVPFPSIGLCPRNRMNWIVLENEATSHFLGANVSDIQKDLFIKFFYAASDPHLSRLGEMSRFFSNETLTADLHLLNGLDLAEVFKYIQVKCEHLIFSCRWRGNPINCCEYFELQFTESGLCYVFNGEISPESRRKAKDNKYYPLSTPQYGEGSGLDVFLRLNRSLITRGRRGVYLMIKQPQQWSDVVRLVPHEAHSRVSIAPRLTDTDERTRAVTPEVRRCIFPDEIDHPAYKTLPGFEYWMGNCRSKCHQEHVVSLCKCNPSIFFPVTDKDNFTVCKASDFKCLYDNRRMFYFSNFFIKINLYIFYIKILVIFSTERHPEEKDYVAHLYKESMICDCFTSCKQLIFDRVFTSTPMDNNDTDTDVGTMRVEIFYQSGWFIQYQTTMRFTFVELLASFGGIIGLFLGASLLSAFELVYYFTIGLFLYLHGDRKLDDTLNQSQTHTPIINIQLGPRKITPIKYRY
ncbi:hypothetical protein KR074_000859 [Drosophila pseudoananassae]|nr:hypothetical protein KR074_000859 [Drosophila pseudoananassae]